MSRHEASYREYTRPTSSGVRQMSNREIVEEAIDTIKMGKRKSLSGRDTLEFFFQDGAKDQSLCREGLTDMQNGIEMLLKGLIQYYGESYVEEHSTDNNGNILKELVRFHQSLDELNDIFTILTDGDYSYMFFKCAKFPRYSVLRTDRRFRNLSYILVDKLVSYVNKYIFTDDYR